jgi:hypothetical protein
MKLLHRESHICAAFEFFAANNYSLIENFFIERGEKSDQEQGSTDPKNC